MDEGIRPICCLCGTYHTSELVCKALGIQYTPYYPTGSKLNPHVCEGCLNKLNMSRSLQKLYGCGEGPS